MSIQRWGTLDSFLEPGAVIGRVSANAGWLTAFLRADPYDEYHFFAPLPPMRDQAKNEFERVFASLPALAKIRWHTWMDLPRTLAETDFRAFHLTDPVTRFTPLQRLRNRYAAKAFPITCLTHSLSYSDYPARIKNHVWPGTLPCDAVICTSRAAQSAMRRMYAAASNDAPAATGRTPQLPRIPLGVAPAAFHAPGGPAHMQARQRVRARLDIGEDAVLLLVFARLSHTGKMDFLPLFRALERVAATFPQGKLCLAAAGRVDGGDPLAAMLSAPARETGVPFRVLQDPDDAQRAGIYAAADIFLSPVDNIQETFGLTLLEAAVCGLPVIASDFDGYRDLVLHGETGFLIPTSQPENQSGLDSLVWLLPSDLAHLCLAQQTGVDVPRLADAILTLARDADLRRRMGDAGRRHVLAGLTYGHAVTRTLALWNELAASAPQQISTALREARHPAEPDYAGVFAAWPSERRDFGGESPLCRRSAYGEAVYKRERAMHIYGGLEALLPPERLRALLVLARKPLSLGNLAARLAAQGTCTHDEAVFCVSWALKQDYISTEPL